MGIKIALEHRTTYRFDRLVILSRCGAGIGILGSVTADTSTFAARRIGAVCKAYDRGRTVAV